MKFVREPVSTAPLRSGEGEEPSPTKAPLLIHIGLHKTASTWLQDHFFTSEERGFRLPDAPRHSLVEQIVMPDPLSFDAAGLAQHYSDEISSAATQGRTLVLSHERLSGYPSSGGRDRGMIAERLKAAFPDGRILIVFREQQSLIRSMYSQHITDGGVDSLSHFLHTPEPGLGRKPSFTLAMYEFDRLIALYQRLFGKDRVLALPVELLARDRQDFADRIARFCGQRSVEVPEIERANERRPLLMQQLQRPLNMLFYHNELSPGALVHIPRFHKRYARFRWLFDRLSPKSLEQRLNRRVQSQIARHVGSYYAESNRRTQELTGLSLAGLGYPVA
jgi:hypothetical protein